MRLDELRQRMRDCGARPAHEALVRSRGCSRPTPAADGGERLLVALADGQTVESVLLPRDGLCVSTRSAARSAACSA
jgi:adenine C2-methylase RlmN of 23S rRNA A2503 and tRNA A37